MSAAPNGSPAIVRIVSLYPDVMDVYADGGNLIALAARCRRRGIEVERIDVSLGDALPEDADLVLIGGGQDREQTRVAPELAAHGPRLREWRDNGVAMLAVCGGYQLFGREYRTSAGVELPGAAVFDVTTVSPAPGDPRHVGEVLAHCQLPARGALPEGGELAGFENHAGRSYLGPGARPFARVERGRGNNGEDGTEGAFAAEAIGIYLHGPLLPRHPALADRLLVAALRHRYGDDAPPLDPLADPYAEAAHRVASRVARERGVRAP
jgi:lipid II isoglutaminyl synthase (glutamine-hydrolysing)